MRYLEEAALAVAATGLRSTSAVAVASVEDAVALSLAAASARA